MRKVVVGHQRIKVSSLELFEARKMSVDYARADFAHVVRRCAGHFEALAAQRRLRFIVETPPAAETETEAEIDVEKIQRVILNLLSNAFKFSPDGGTIRCTLAVGRSSAKGAGEVTEEEIVVFDVADSGPGVPSELREVIFERFARIEGEANLPAGGTGLGLSIARELVALHGGQITVGDATEGGALFRVKLPRHAPEGVPVEASSRSTNDSTERDASIGGDLILQGLVPERVVISQSHSTLGVAQSQHAAPSSATPVALVVEDNPDLNRFICETLNPEFRTERAFDGRDGLVQAMRLYPDLIVTDIMMPQLSGDEMIRALRRRGAPLDSTPVIVLTARADDDLRIRLLDEQGAQDFLIKPFSAGELRARARNLAMAKRARDVLARGLNVDSDDLFALATEAVARKREASRNVGGDDRSSSTENAALARRPTAVSGPPPIVVVSDQFSDQFRAVLAAMNEQIARLRQTFAKRLAPANEKKLLAKLSALTNSLSDLLVMLPPAQDSPG